jgi:hypothetical protein
VVAGNDKQVVTEVLTPRIVFLSYASLASKDESGKKKKKMKLNKKNLILKISTPIFDFVFYPIQRTKLLIPLLYSES